MSAAMGPLLADPKRLLLDLVRERSLPKLLDLVVTRLGESPRVALVRVWLIQKSLDCSGCPMAAECPDRSLCLHLVASGGRSVVDPAETGRGPTGRSAGSPWGCGRSAGSGRRESRSRSPIS